MNENNDNNGIDSSSCSSVYSEHEMTIVNSSENIDHNTNNTDEDFCIICYEPDDLVLYNHCGKMLVHPICLLLWMSKQNNSCFLCRCDVVVEHCLDDHYFNIDIFVFKHAVENICNNHKFICCYTNNVQNSTLEIQNNHIDNNNYEMIFRCVRDVYCIKFVHRLNKKKEITLSFFEPQYSIILSEDVSTYMYILFKSYYYCYEVEKAIIYICSWHTFQKSFCLIALFIGYIAEYIFCSILLMSIYVFIQCQRGLTYVDDNTFY